MVELDRSAVPLKSGKGIYSRLRIGINLLSAYEQAARIRLLKFTFRTGSLGSRRYEKAIWVASPAAQLLSAGSGCHNGL